ncbi:MAG: hypothetical protein CMD98_06665 [Gammaproteobacteria bacterium]|nr:hypothetical protein [Gammaproteobacteria bacterium]|tara:strand:+ start:8791 stop:9255 length:465 start_codon:yes stop_codon:yes gene_type:complete
MDIENSIALVSLSIFLLMTFSLIVMIWYGRSNKLIYLVIPLVLWLSVSTYSTIQGLLGYPVLAKDIPEGNIYLSHTVGKDQEWLYFWLIDINTYVPKAYKIVYTEEGEKLLAEAKEKSGLGNPQGLKLQLGSSEQETEKQITIYNFNKLEGIIK